jgi:protein O-mannosyl-transferase
VKRTRVPVVLVLAVAVAVAMGLSVHNGFVYDDVPAIVQNTRISDPSRWHTILSAPYWQGTLWRPLTVFGFALQWWAGHGTPMIFHVVSLLGYLAGCVLLAALLRWLEVDAVAALLAVLLFAVHPVHVEVVANVVGQSELWVTLAMIAATWTYVRARRDGGEQRALLPLLVLVALGITSKEHGFVIPGLLIGAEWLLVEDDRPWWRRLRMLIPVLIVAALLFGLRALNLHDVKGEFAAIPLRDLSFPQRALTFLGVVPEYARLLFWPAHLQADYGPPGTPVGGPFALRHLLGAIIVMTVFLLMLATRRRAPVVAFGFWWAIVCIAPLSNLLTPSGLVMAERALFLPSVGFAMALAGGLGAVAVARARQGHRTLIASPLVAVAALLAALGACRSARRVPTWSTQQRFFADLAQDAPTAYRGWKVAGEYARSQYDNGTAAADLARSIALWPHDEAVFDELGQLYRADGHCDRAIPIFVQGVAVRADDSSLRAKLVECLIVQRQWDDATRYAAAGVASGQDEFRKEQARIDAARAATTGISTTP